MALARNSLWANRDFMKLWIGQTVSQVGAQITLLALPLMAVQLIHATPVQMGLLRAAEYLPFVFFGLFAGVLCDRVGCRPLLVVSDLARAAFLAAIPVVALLGPTPIGLLYAVAFLVGVATVFFDVAYWSYLPSLIERDELVKGNSKLSLSQSAAEALGPGAAGVLIQLLTAPFAIALNAASFLLSALSLLMIRRRVEPAAAAPTDAAIFAKLFRGLGFVFRDVALRALLLRATVWNFLYNLALPVFVLHCAQTLGLNATLIGLLFTAMGVGLVAGAVLLDNVLSERDVASLINASLIAGAAGGCGLALRLDHPVAQMASLMVGLFVIGVATAVYNVSNVSLRQRLTPPALLGQMTAAMRFVSWGCMPFGALLGGVLAERIGFAPTLLAVGLVGLSCAVVGMLSSTLQRVIPLAAADGP